MSGPQVFISYRRADSTKLAVEAANDLKDDLGLDNVFLDTEDIWPGDDFPEELEANIRESDVTLILIGKRWAGEYGEDRLNDPTDWVRREVATALNAPGDLIPVMVSGAELPTELPDDIARLKSKQQLHVDSSDYYTAYQSILVSVWYRVAKRNTILVVADDTVEAEVHIDQLVSKLAEQDLVDSRELSRSVARGRGLRAIPLSDAAKRWPKVIVLATDDALKSPAFLARLRGLIKARDVAVVAGTSAIIIGGQRVARASEFMPDVVDSAPIGSSEGTEAADVSRVLTEIKEQGTLTSYSSTSELGTWMKRGWWRALSTGVKAAILAPLVAVAAVAGVVALDNPEPISLAGAWEVSDFGFSSASDTNNRADLEGGRMVFEPVAGCLSEPCALRVVEGPSLLQDVVMEPKASGSEYVGENVPLVASCNNVEVPRELTETSLTARASKNDDLEFLITLKAQPWSGCDAIAAEYSAVARRAG